MSLLYIFCKNWACRVEEGPHPPFPYINIRFTHEVCKQTYSWGPVQPCHGPVEARIGMLRGRPLIIWGCGADFCERNYFFGNPPNQIFIFFYQN